MIIKIVITYYSYAEEKIFKMLLNCMFQIPNKNKISKPQNEVQ